MSYCPVAGSKSNPFSDAGPIDVKLLDDTARVGDCVKTWNVTGIRSATGSPRPVPGAVCGSDSVQYVSWAGPPGLEVLVSVIASLHVPGEPWPTSVLSGCWGLNGPVSNGTDACWTGVEAKSSKMEFLKLECGGAPNVPTCENSGMTVPSGAMRDATRS